MDSRRATTRRIATGALLTIGMLGIFLLVFFVDEIREARSATYAIAILMEEAHEVRPGNVVRVAGRPVGTVESVDLRDAPSGGPERIVATVELSTQARPHVRRQSRVRFAMQGLGGDGVIDIMPGPRAAPPLRPGDTLVAAPRVDRDRLARRTGAVLRAWDSLAASVAAVRAAANGPETGLADVLAEFGTAGAELDRLARRYRAGPAAEMLGDDALLGAVRRLRRLTAAVRRGLDQAGAPSRSDAEGDGAIARAQALGAAIDRMVVRADVLRVRLARLGERMRLRGGLPARFPADTVLEAALRRVRAQLDSLVAEARDDPLRFVF